MIPRKRVRLRWTGRGRVYSGSGENGREIQVDGAGRDGPSPMDALLLGLAGCMAIDVQDILEKSRVVVEHLEVEALGERAPDPPRRFTRIRLVYRVKGVSEVEAPKLDRAIALSRDKYCSVLHSLRPDLELEIEAHHD